MTANTAPASQTELHLFDVRIARTREEFAEIVSLREVVFRDEQAIVDSITTDNDDWSSIHAYAVVGGKTVAAGRLTPPATNRPEAQIAWVSTLSEYRRQGAGGAIVRALLDSADLYQFPSVLISAQTHAIPFYRRFGFAPYGNAFLVRGIEHQYMERRAPTARG